MDAIGELQDLLASIEAASMFDDGIVLQVRRGLALIAQVQQDHRAELAQAHASAFRRASQDRPLQEWASLARRLEDALQGLEGAAERIETATITAQNALAECREAALALEI